MRPRRQFATGKKCYNLHILELSTLCQDLIMLHLPPVLRASGPARWLTQILRSRLSICCLHPFQYKLSQARLSGKQPLRWRSVHRSALGIRTQGRKEVHPQRSILLSLKLEVDQRV
ncbi:unnamed protein product [Gulo gulo]|uniref:Uncharacterized protein n=1 Tax=Gulo gulo TaxID=48420 RepID=A0A9X9Q5S1_GULGU|nr:unnamed protein product [Gulo gulo]